MKKHFITALYIITMLPILNINAQVAIGKTVLTNNSVLLEFGNETKGIILPSTSTVPASVGGTFIYNPASKSVQVWEQRDNGGTGGWLNLTEINMGISHAFTNTGPDTTATSGVIMGAETSNKKGVLVLESSDKALVLPIVESPHTTMPSSVAGTMVYDPLSDTLAVYDGATWNFWK
jgi:hypothetical protein